MLGQELDDARLGVNLAGARGRTTSARSPSGGATRRASWRCRRCPVVVRVELLDLLFEPGETLLEFRALGFERVDHLLNAGRLLLLVRRDLLGLGPETCCVRGTSARGQDDAGLAREVHKYGIAARDGIPSNHACEPTGGRQNPAASRCRGGWLVNPPPSSSGANA